MRARAPIDRTSSAVIRKPAPPRTPESGPGAAVHPGEEVAPGYAAVYAGGRPGVVGDVTQDPVQHECDGLAEVLRLAAACRIVLGSRKSALMY
jgi:hypothetical protein